MAEYLSKHFTLEEMIASDTAKAYGISNAPTEAHKKVLAHTCNYLLEPLRDLLTAKYGKCYVHINSGYRSANLNTKIKGSAKKSQHMTGEAADIRVTIVATGATLDYTTLYEDIKFWVKTRKLSVDQCIDERAGKARWVHVSHCAAGKTKDRRQFLKYNNGTYTLDNK